MCNKIQAKITMSENNVPVIPGIKEIKNNKEVINFGEKFGYPLLVKAASGGGGKGMRIIYNEMEIENALIAAKNESQKSFNDSTVYIEKYI